MCVVTRLGDKGILWLVIAAILLFFKKYRKCSVTMVTGLLSGVLIGNVLLKNIIARPRPCWLNTAVDMLISVPTDYSFPSGHTLSSFIAVTVLMYYNRYFGFAGLIMALFIAFSRLYLYVHFPTDVLAGAVLGVLLGCFSIFIVNRISSATKDLKKKSNRTM